MEMSLVGAGYYCSLDRGFDRGVEVFAEGRSKREFFQDENTSKLEC